MISIIVAVAENNVIGKLEHIKNLLTDHHQTLNTISKFHK